MGADQSGEDRYIGWEVFNIQELFRYTWAIDTNYFFTIEASLMIASKGGFNINILNSMGIKTKKRYFDSLNLILKDMYSTKSKSSSNEIVDGNIPENFNFGG